MQSPADAKPAALPTEGISMEMLDAALNQLFGKAMPVQGFPWLCLSPDEWRVRMRRAILSAVRRSTCPDYPQCQIKLELTPLVLAEAAWEISAENNNNTPGINCG